MNICLQNMCIENYALDCAVSLGTKECRKMNWEEEKYGSSFLPPSLPSCFPAFIPFTKVTPDRARDPEMD